MNGLSTSYHNDFYAWLIHNASLMRQGKLAEIDFENVAEELEAMGRSEKRELVNRLAVLMMHLLKWAYQPQKRTNSWKYTIREQRKRLLQLLKDSPSLKHDLEQTMSDAYETAILKAARETRLDENHFPKECPFSLQEILSNEFYPSD